MSGVPTDKERAFIQAEYTQLIGEMNGTASSTRFSGESLLDGTGEQFSRPVDFLVGTSVKDAMTLDVSNLAKRVLAFTSEHLGGLARPTGTSTAFASTASTAAGQAVADGFSQTHAVTEINRLIQVADAATTVRNIERGPGPRSQYFWEQYGGHREYPVDTRSIPGPRRDALSAEIEYLTGRPGLSLCTPKPNLSKPEHPPYCILHLLPLRLALASWRPLAYCYGCYTE